MKKIFAIALALVMVLSMASAFASQCTAGFDWSCATTVNKCGKGNIEVVPYVKVNNSCGGYDWQISECASAVNTEKVYYALKLTVDANPDLEWWGKAKVTVTYKGMENTAPTIKNFKAKDDDEVNTYYYDFIAEAWDVVDDDFVLGNEHVKEEVVKKASEAKVCAELASTVKFTEGTVGNYYVKYTENTKLEVLDKKDGKVLVTYTIKDDKVSAIKYSNVCGADTYETIKAFFGLEINTCVDADLIKANFAWDDSFKDCFAWGDKAPSIVDAECVVAIPKTGDVSVVAYAVMAVVAAAGAMLKK